jgi:PEP-CTERM motif-containing protein
VRSGNDPRARFDLSIRSGCARVLYASALACLCASNSAAQVASQRRIPLKKEPRHVDTVWVHDTVTITRVDTIRLAAATPFFDAAPVVPRIDTVTLTRVDTTKSCRDLFLPIPIPIPFGRTTHDNPIAALPPSTSVNVTPEPSTIVMVGAGLVAVGLYARRKRSKKVPPV